MLRRVMEYFSDKVGEKLADYVHSNVCDTTNLDLDLDFTTLEMNLNSLCAVASDVKDLAKANVSGKKRRKGEVEYWLKQVQVVETDFHELRSHGLFTRFLSGGRVARLSRRINELVEQSRYFGEVLIDTRGEALLTTEMFGAAFEENLEMILDLLVDDKKASVGIYGMGGVGKTTLTKHVYNRLLEETRDCVIWVTVSQVFSITKLQDQIAQAINLRLSDEDDKHIRARDLNLALSKRESIVLILDDVWENINLQEVGCPLGREGYRLIITTRSLKVCHQIGCKKMIEVKTLYCDEAWDLLKETLGYVSIAPEVEEIAKCMVKMCDGLPLGIITLAGSMRGETAIHVWRNACAELKRSSMGQDDMEDQVYKVLKYSFDRLVPNHQRQERRNGNTNLQRCFLYCALYPEGCKIPRNELVRKFISEELVDSRKSMKAQYEEGHSMLDKLVNICLLESSHIHVNGDSVKMHDLIRAMALKITEGTTLVTAGHYNLMEIPRVEEWSEDLENLSLIQNSIKIIPFDMSPNCPKLSILLLSDNPLVALPDPFLSRMHALCTLDLSRTRIPDLPDSVSDLKRLKALLLGGCRELAYVPNLEKLKELRELDLSNSGIRNMPEGTEQLLKLKRLLLNGASYLRMLPTGMLLNLKNLQLLLLPCHIQTPVQEIRTLKQLEKFEGTVEDAPDISHFLRSRQCRAHGTFYNIEVRLVYDRLSRRRNQVILDRGDSEKGDEKHAIMSAQDTLVIHRCGGLSNCLADDFSPLEDPKSLVLLKIYNSRGIECIMASKEIESQFSSVEKILLQDLPDFIGLIHKQKMGSAIVSASPTYAHAAFSSLKYLTICKCNKMKKLGMPALEFPNLEILCVQYCDEVQEIIEVAHGTGIEAGIPVVSLPRLRHLYLIRLPKLMSICKATMLCDSLNIIHVEECQALRKLPLYFPASAFHTLHGGPYQCLPPPSLEEIWIVEEEREWWESLEWEHPIHSHLIRPFLRFWD